MVHQTNDQGTTEPTREAAKEENAVPRVEGTKNGVVAAHHAITKNGLTAAYHAAATATDVTAVHHTSVTHE